MRYWTTYHRHELSHYYPGLVRLFGYKLIYSALRSLNDNGARRTSSAGFVILRVTLIRSRKLGRLEPDGRRRNRFGTERWAEFRKDVAWFEQPSVEYWKACGKTTLQPLQSG